MHGTISVSPCKDLEKRSSQLKHFDPQFFAILITGRIDALAWQLMEIGEGEESAELFARALALRPKKQSLTFNAGNAAAFMAQKGALRPARKILESFVKADPSHSNAR